MHFCLINNFEHENIENISKINSHLEISKIISFWKCCVKTTQESADKFLNKYRPNETDIDEDGDADRFDMFRSGWKKFMIRLSWFFVKFFGLYVTTYSLIRYLHAPNNVVLSIIYFDKITLL